MSYFRHGWTGALVLALLVGCNGQGDNAAPTGLNPPGGGSGGGGSGGGGDTSYEPGIFLPASTFANRCANPRSGFDPFNGDTPYPDLPGSVTDENNFLRSWTNDTYLWYSEVPDLDPSSYETLAYFDLLKTAATTVSGAPKDKFHFWYDTAEWLQLSQSGVIAGYGAQWFLISTLPPRKAVVAYVEPGSPAAAAGLERGDSVLTVDGEDFVAGNTEEIVAILNAGLFPSDSGETHDFTIERRSGGMASVTMTSATITTDPVEHRTFTSDGITFGYILFNDHIATAESQLVAAFTALAAANVDELVLDLRYNGGGYLDIAAEVGYMIAGTQSTGQIFERMAFNDKHPSTDPITGQAIVPTPFHATTQGFDMTPGTPLPTLNLSRVAVITGESTCSASEAIINGLRGIGVEVYQIGSTTCGKPYGFYPQDNCGTTYFSIQFQGNNAQGFGDYTDGFSPQNMPGGPFGEAVPGCQVRDDFDRDLGSLNEARLMAAVQYINTNTCPTASETSVMQQRKAGQPHAKSGLRMYKSPFHQNRIMRR